MLRLALVLRLMRERHPIMRPARMDLKGSGGEFAQVLGEEFRANSIEIDAARDDITLTGFASLPTR